jgi:hypothetical protein
MGFCQVIGKNEGASGCALDFAQGPGRLAGSIRLGSITQSAGGTTGPEVTMSYDAVGLITQTVFSNDGIGNIVKTKYMYHSAENLTTIMSYFTWV